MSSVGSSDSSSGAGSAEIQRRNAEAAKKHEAELVKKQAKEMRRMNEDHYSEVQRIKQDHSSRLDNVRQQAREEISELDHKHQQDIEEMRDVYRKQMMEQADESRSREGALHKALEGESQQQKAQLTDTNERLTKDFNRNLAKAKEEFSESLDEARGRQREAIERNRENLTRAYDGNLKTLSEGRNQQVGELQRNYDEYRVNAEGRLRDQDLRHLQDQERNSKELLRAINRERQSSEDKAAMLRDGFREGLEKTRQRFENRARDERNAGNISRSQMKNTVTDRVDNEVARLKAENRDLREANAGADLERQFRTQREIGNMQEAFQKNVDAYKMERDETIRAANDNNRRDVEHVRDELNHQAVENNRNARAKQDELDKIHRQAYGSLKLNTDLRAKAIQDNADARVKHLYETTSDEKERMAQQQIEGHTASQHSHQDDMRALRASMDNDKQIAVNTLQEHIQKQEIKHQERMAQVVAKYEKQVQGLKDEIAKEKKTNDENMKRLVDEMQRMHKVALDQEDSKTRERLRLLSQQHQEELRSLNKRNEEKMDQVLGEIKRT